MFWVAEGRVGVEEVALCKEDPLAVWCKCGNVGGKEAEGGLVSGGGVGLPFVGGRIGGSGGRDFLHWDVRFLGSLFVDVRELQGDEGVGS